MSENCTVLVLDSAPWRKLIWDCWICGWLLPSVIGTTWWSRATSSGLEAESPMCHLKKRMSAWAFPCKPASPVSAFQTPRMIYSYCHSCSHFVSSWVCSILGVASCTTVTVVKVIQVLWPPTPPHAKPRRKCPLPPVWPCSGTASCWTLLLYEMHSLGFCNLIFSLSLVSF